MKPKRSVLPLILVVVVGMAVGITALALWLMTPKSIYEGFYSAMNENRAPISTEEYVRDVFVDQEGAGRLSTCDEKGASLDVIAFGSYELRGDKIRFCDLRFYGQREGRKVTKEEDGSYSLTLPFSLKEGGFVLDSCHYERIKA